MWGSKTKDFPGGPVLGIWVWFLIWEDPRCCGATKVLFNLHAYSLQPVHACPAAHCGWETCGGGGLPMWPRNTVHSPRRGLQGRRVGSSRGFLRVQLSTVVLDILSVPCWCAPLVVSSWLHRRCANLCTFVQCAWKVWLDMKFFFIIDEDFQDYPCK